MHSGPRSESRVWTARSAHIAAFALPLLLALPFDPDWLDFERARRALLLVLAALLALVTLAGAPRAGHRPRGPLLALALLPAFGLLSLLWAHDALHGAERVAYWLALAALPFVLPRGRRARHALLAGLACAAALTSLYGLAQALGLDWPQGYAVAPEPVSSFGNRNAAAEWTVLAAAAVLGLGPRAAVPLLALLGLYLGVNGGRAALLGWALLGALFVFCRARVAPRAQWPRPALAGLAAALLLGPLLGALFLRAAPDPMPPPAAGAATDPVRDAPSTLAVRRLLYPAVLDLAFAELPLGTGAGQFALAFPPHRDPREIALSMQGAGGRPTRVTTAHDDPLELFAELGVFGLFVVGLALAGTVRLVLRRRLPLLGAGALLAFVPLTLARAPLANAPAAFALVALLAQSLPTWRHAARGLSPRVVRPVLALLLLLAGLPALLGLQAFAAHARALRGPEPLPDYGTALARLDTAVAVDPAAIEWRFLRALRVRQLGRTVQAALQQLDPGLAGAAAQRAPLEELAEDLAVRRALVPADLQAVLARSPHHYGALYTLALTGFEDAALRPEGRAAITHLRQLHPGYRDADAVAAAYAQLEQAVTTLQQLAEDPRGVDAQAGHAAILALRRQHPGRRDFARLQLRYELLRLDQSAVLALLRELHDEELLARTRADVEAAAQKATPESALRLLQLHTRLGTLGRELFPEAAQFR